MYLLKKMYGFYYDNVVTSQIYSQNVVVAAGYKFHETCYKKNAV